ncbi:MAG TPA: fasciclin domain-containing protein [Chitinophagaceae bacterium]|jgi:uncharacterized surface protein with fasciclin (FAS1) repeats|nr:fasciclin domain-containing protein [Chitinophagaceae bacterium]
MKKHFSKILAAFAILFLFFTYSSCKKLDLVTTTTTDVNIFDYLKQHPEEFSEFVKILDKTGYSGFLNAYGSYTLFAPTNSAIQTYLQQNNKTSIDQLDDTELKNLVKFHLIQDTIGTNSFKDGKLPLVTMLGQYLVTGVVNKNGVSSYLINRQATVTQSNIRAGNGIIQVVDNVLIPAKFTLAQLIEQNPDYSIFTQALKETGFYDSLNITNNTNATRRFLTVFAETNKALQDSGINSYAALKTKYSNTGNPKNTKDSLYLYVAYHINTDANYLADIVTTSSLPTLAPLEILTPRLDDQTVLLNDIDFNGVHEKGISLDRARSDISATNGVLHTANAHFAIKNRQPFPLYWDVADFPEVRKMPAVFRKSSLSFALGSIKDITWEKNSITYQYTTAANFPVYYNDYLQIPLGLTNTARNKWVELRTPLIVKGRYKVWICYRQQKASNNNPPFPTQVSFDGEPLSRFVDFGEFGPGGTEGEQEALGWKRYTEIQNSGTYVGRLVGTIDVKSTDRHVIRLECISGNGQDQNNLDMIHIIPVNMPQTRPLFKRDGTLIP